MINYLIAMPGWLSDGLDKVAGAVIQAIRTLCYSLDTLIYKLIISFYNIFEGLCTAKIFSSSEFAEIGRRIGFLLGMMMFFKVIFSMIQMLLEPDNISDKSKGATAIIKKCVLVIVMLGLSDFVFNTLHEIQNITIKNHVISNLILPASVDTDNFGKVLSEKVLLSFYTLDERASGTIMYEHCGNYIVGLQNQIYTSSNFDLGYNCLNETVEIESNLGSNVMEKQEINLINFNYILSVLVGIAFLWLLFNYCIKVGVRVIQLAVLEIISPMAFVGYLAQEKDGIFQKWQKLYFATYIDAFLRIAIINFVIYICAVILDNWKTATGTFWDSISSTIAPDTFTNNLVGIIMLFALLTFAKKAPELLKELLPASASKLGFGASMKDIVGLQKGIGMVAGSATGAAVGFLGGAIAGTGLRGKITGAFGGLGGGIVRGTHAGFGAKGVGAAIGTARKNQSDYTKKMADIRANGGSWFGSKMSGFQQALTGRSGYDILEEEYKDAEDYVSTYDSLKKKADSEVNKFEDNYKFTDSTGRTMTLSELNKARNDDVHYTETERAAFETIYNKIHGFARDQAMSNNGAIKNGEMVWTDSGTGDWRDIEASRRDRFTASDISVNAEISAKMQKMLKSEHAGTHGTNFDKVKAANDYYEGKVQSKINDDKYKRAKANAGK